MAWTALSYIVFQRDILTTNEFSALLNECPTPEDKVNSILTNVAQEVVSRVNAGRRKLSLPAVVNTGKSIPSGAIRHAYILARRDLTDTYPSLSEFNGDDRKNSVEEANNYLDDLANNNADSDEAGAASFVTSSSSAFTYGGKSLMDFATAP
jgi:hypothetical protein